MTPYEVRDIAKELLKWLAVNTCPNNAFLPEYLRPAYRKVFRGVFVLGDNEQEVRQRMIDALKKATSNNDFWNKKQKEYLKLNQRK